MPTRKIRDIDPSDTQFNPCRHPSHNPPSMMVYTPGEYEHECPGCGNIVSFTVFPKHWWQVNGHQGGTWMYCVPRSCLPINRASS